MRQLPLFILLLFYFNIAATSIATEGLSNDDKIIGIWSVNLIDFTDCQDALDDLSLDMRFSNCFEQVGNDVCIQMLMDFKSNGSLIQTFRVLSDGKLIDDKKEYSNYTIAEDKITICGTMGNHCETSDIVIDQNQLMISGRDVVNRCNLVLKSTK